MAGIPATPELLSQVTYVNLTPSMRRNAASPVGSTRTIEATPMDPRSGPGPPWPSVLPLFWLLARTIARAFPRGLMRCWVLGRGDGRCSWPPPGGTACSRPSASTRRGHPWRADVRPDPGAVRGYVHSLSSGGRHPKAARPMTPEIAETTVMRFHPLAFLYRLVLLLALSLAGLSGLAAAVQAPIVAVVPLGIVAYRRLGRFAGGGDAYGSARPSTLGELIARGRSAAMPGSSSARRATPPARPRPGPGRPGQPRPRFRSGGAAVLLRRARLAAGGPVARPHPDIVHGAVIGPGRGREGRRLFDPERIGI